MLLSILVLALCSGQHVFISSPILNTKDRLSLFFTHSNITHAYFKKDLQAIPLNSSAVFQPLSQYVQKRQKELDHLIWEKGHQQDFFQYLATLYQ